MSKPKGSITDRRGSDREQLYALMPVSLIVKSARGGERMVSGCLYDVSAEGLCLIVREELAESSGATLVTLDERIPFVIAWVHKDADRAFRCGLRLVGSDRDLRQLFSSSISRRAVG